MTAQLTPGSLVAVASGMGHATALPVGSCRSALHVARLDPEDSVELPVAPWIHLYVTRGAVDVGEVRGLHAGDAVRLTGAADRRAWAGHHVQARESAEILVWEMHATL